MKKFRVLFTTILLVIFSVTFIVNAAGEEINGSVSVTLKDGDTPVCGAELTLYKVAEAQLLNGNFRYSFTEDFTKAFAGTPEELQSTEEILKISDYAVKNNISGLKAVTNSAGFLKFENISVGLYLVVQSDSVSGFSDCTPFLISVPMEINGQWVYDIDATPKTDIVRLVDISVKKVWNDDGSNRPESVTVQLLMGDTAVGTAVLNEENGWIYIWRNQPKSDEYSVREVNIPSGYAASYSNSGFEYTVTNSSVLIHTGQVKWPIPFLECTGLLLLACGWSMHLREKRKN